MSQDHVHDHAASPEPHHMMMHAMSFHFGSSETILFDFWKTSSPLGLIVSCFVVFFGCVGYESLAWMLIHRRNSRVLIESQVPITGRRKIDIGLIVDTLIHGLQLFLGYCAMLIFMTFNVWLCLAVIFGIIFAHLGFRILYPQLDSIPQTPADPCC
ncbi:unnamed protein product [Bursaphelenchus xylophilus]|uniref:Copper transport protein n=1 Tax=Bursaphelenchus xylophilus TaxID=6326 RepID=A0A1I7SVU9_BURXY|nr:unnamed protein product [Bursaphelenchus xylophilus]CAG9098308.1 unnamed protein product [Bursaphelenchus xylophilus]